MARPTRIKDGDARARRPYAPRLPPGQRREQLLDAALVVILEHGYSGVSIEAVARAAGVTRPVIYDHFPNLGALLYSLVEREERYALAQLESVVPTELPEDRPGQTLPVSVRRLLEEIRTRPATWTLILLPPEGTPEIVRRHVERNRERTRERIEQMVRAAMRRPELPEDLDVELAARSIQELTEAAGRMVLTDPERHNPERYEQFATSLMRLVWPLDDRVR